VLSVSILQLGAEQREERAGGVSEPFCGTRELVDEWRRATRVDFGTRPLVHSSSGALVGGNTVFALQLYF
jgi:hypothetical protein